MGCNYAPIYTGALRVHARRPARKKTISTTLKGTAIAAAPRQPAEDGVAAVTPRYHAVVGLDVGDRQRHSGVRDLDGNVVAAGARKTTEASCRVLFEGKGRMRIALEAGPPAPWISRLVIALGHDVGGGESAAGAADCGEQWEE